MKTYVKVIHWLPRIICILAILFVSLFAADAFDHGENIWQKIGCFFNAPHSLIYFAGIFDCSLEMGVSRGNNLCDYWPGFQSCCFYAQLQNE